MTGKGKHKDRPSEHVERDADTVDLFAGFIAESVEGLDQVDQILIQAERGKAEQEQINALFRVFHTIKGVSGFLAADDVTRLSHVTETLLGRVREGEIPLAGRELAVIFEATAAMRELFTALKQAIEHARAIPVDPATAELVARIEACTEVEPAPRAASLPPASTAAVAEASPSGALAQAEAGAPAQTEAGGGRIRETVKVDLDRIDSVVEMIGELIIVESMITNAAEIRAVGSPLVRNNLSQLTKISRDLQSVAMRMRMVPVRGVFRKMARLVRDLGHKTGKNVRLVQLGEATEMDRSMVERLEDPLVHMIRNAIDHAVETPAERAALGKPEMATITLSAQHEGGSVSVDLSDDGRGLARDAILKKARERGLVEGSGESMSDGEVHALIFLPGFSTAAQVSELSGRGVGMDVVKRSIEALRGRVVVASTPGRGTSFKLVLPLTLAIIDGMVVTCGAERYIVPSLAVVESLQPTAGMVRRVGRDGELVNVRGEILALRRLGQLFDVPGFETAPERARVVVLESGHKKLGLLVDDVLTQQQVVIKALSAGVGNAEFLSGAAIMSDGRVGLIVNVDRLNEVFGGSHRSRRDHSEAAA
ncbi:MAG TPA: chemotaxis protein CheA [Polyangiaceae bacterium]|nr:chemotaxis protein CheA [Polyangiaceae bacterium]